MFILKCLSKYLVCVVTENFIFFWSRIVFKTEDITLCGLWATLQGAFVLLTSTERNETAGELAVYSCYNASDGIFFTNIPQYRTTLQLQMAKSINSVFFNTLKNVIVGKLLWCRMSKTFWDRMQLEIIQLYGNTAPAMDD